MMQVAAEPRQAEVYATMPHFYFDVADGEHITRDEAAMAKPLDVAGRPSAFRRRGA